MGRFLAYSFKEYQESVMSQRALIKACMVFAFSFTWEAHWEAEATFCCQQTLIMWIWHNESLFRRLLSLKCQHGDRLCFSKAPQVQWEPENALKPGWLQAFYKGNCGISGENAMRVNFAQCGTFLNLHFSLPDLKASLDLFLQSHFTRAQANSPRPVMTSSGPNPKVSQGTLASQTQSQSQQSQLLVGQSHNSPGSSGREQREQRSSRSSRRKGSDSSVPEEDKDRREETAGRGEDESTSNTDGTVNVEHAHE